MKNIQFIRLIMTAIILYSLGLSSCKKNYERLMFVKTISIDPNSLVARGEVTDVGNGTVEYGFCFGTNANPSLENSSSHNAGKTSSPVSFQADLSGVLVEGAVNYVRSYEKSGQGTSYGETLKVSVPTNVEYVFDDGSGETSWQYKKGTEGYLGNLFPVTSTGNIISVKLLFSSADTIVGTDRLTVEFFDKNQNSIASTASFFPSTTDWISLSGLNIHFSGNFYAMVHWNKTADITNYLDEDLDGPDTHLDLAYYSDGSGWARVSSLSAGSPGVFLIRVTARITSGKGSIIKEFSPDTEPSPGSGVYSKPCNALPPAQFSPVSK